MDATIPSTTSRATPITSITAEPGCVRTRPPTGSRPGQYRRAIVWLMTATGGAPSRSEARSGRPARMSMPSVWK